MEFPFEVPADLTALSGDEFAAFAATVRTYAQDMLGQDNVDPAHLIATRDLFNTVTAEETRRTEVAAAAETERANAETARAELAAGLQPTPEPEPTPEPAPPAPEPVLVVRPTVPAAASASTIDQPPAQEEPQLVSMVASSDTPNVGQRLTSFRDASALIEARLRGYSAGKGKLTPTQLAARRVGKNAFKIGGRSLVRHNVISFEREFPADLRITDTQNPMSVLEHAVDQRRLPGGSLIRSAELAVAAGRSLTAAVGWCAPSETIYDLCALESMDGLLDIPEVQAARGGFFIPEDGGPDFASIFEGIGDEGDVILSEYDVEQGTEKVCVEIPCPPFVEVRLDVAYVCITGSLLQRRGYPEAVTRFSQGAMTALAHKINESVIARIVAASGGPTAITPDADADDAASALLSAVEVAIEDIKYRNRMARSATLEVVLPAWTLASIRAALARRRGVMAWDVSDAEILAAFTTRRAVPRFVYDWQDAFSGLVGGPGGASPLQVLPSSVQFLVYPAGTWTKAVQDVVNLDTVYDNALLTSNQYTALFAEDGFNVLQMCVDSRLYSTTLPTSQPCCDAA